MCNGGQNACMVMCASGNKNISPAQEFIQCDRVRTTPSIIPTLLSPLRSVCFDLHLHCWEPFFIAANYSLSDAFPHIVSLALFLSLLLSIQQLRCISFAKFIFLVKTENGIRRVRWWWYVVCVGRQMIIWVIAAIAWEWKRHQMNNDNKIWKSFASSLVFVVSVPVAIGTAAAIEWNGSH